MQHNCIVNGECPKWVLGVDVFRSEKIKPQIVTNQRIQCLHHWKGHFWHAFYRNLFARNTSSVKSDIRPCKMARSMYFGSRIKCKSHVHLIHTFESHSGFILKERMYIVRKKKPKQMQMHPQYCDWIGGVVSMFLCVNTMPNHNETLTANKMPP